MRGCYYFDSNCAPIAPSRCGCVRWGAGRRWRPAGSMPPRAPAGCIGSRHVGMSCRLAAGGGRKWLITHCALLLPRAGCSLAGRRRTPRRRPGCGSGARRRWACRQRTTCCPAARQAERGWGARPALPCHHYFAIQHSCNLESARRCSCAPPAASTAGAAAGPTCLLVVSALFLCNRKAATRIMACTPGQRRARGVCSWEAACTGTSLRRPQMRSLGGYCTILFD